MPDLGTVTVTEERSASVKKIVFDWLSVNGGGDAGKATKSTTYTYTGVLERAVFVPDAAATQPTNLYDVAVNDEDGHDVLCGLGADLSNAAYVSKTPANGLGAVVNDTLSLSVTNAGNAKGGIVILYLR